METTRTEPRLRMQPGDTMATKKVVTGEKPRFKKPRKKTGFNNTFVYAMGCRFRSKLEWRVAVRLEKANITWQFEPRVQLQDSYVLPDFYLPEYKLFIEVRPKKMIDERLMLKVRLLKKIYEKEVVVIIDPKGAETFIAKLIAGKKEPQHITGLDEVMIFEGARGDRKENKSHAVPTHE